jgi:2,3-bisphosphoglycerate-dependent phosphoglycerate mutase
VKTIWINATQSEYDAQNLYTGWHDPELTEQGVTEATQIAKDLSDKYSEVADVYCSDLRRSFNTAKIICDNTNWNKTQQVSPFIRDRDYGNLSGNQLDTMLLWKDAPENGESLKDVALRVYSFLKEIQDTETQLPHVIIAHSDTLTAAAVVVGKLDLTEINNFRAHTGEILEWDF